MDIQERKAFENALKKRHENILRWVMWVESIQGYVMNPKIERHRDVYAVKAYRKIQDFLYAWKAAQSAAVPPWAVIVPKLSANYLYNQVPELGFKNQDEKDTVLYHLNYMASEFKEDAKAFVIDDQASQKAMLDIEGQ